MSFTSRIASAAARGYGMFRIAAAAAVDPFFNYVTALLHGNGTNGAQNNTFLDSSTNNFTITRNGNTTQGTFAPYGANWSNYFNGSSYITTPNVVALSADFTIETWVYYPNSINNGFYVGAINASGYGYWCFYYNTSVSAFRVVGSSSGTFIQSPSVTLQPNQWIHVAVTRSGSTVTWWVNGTSIGTTTNSTNWTGSASTTYIGSIDGTNQNFTGYLSNLRVVVGTAVYTSNFTPSTVPLTAISGTWLLTAKSNRFLDNSTNNYALTSTGTSVQVFSPFNLTSAYSTSSNGGSGYFDGSGDYLTVPDSTAFTMGTGDFSVECWYYPTNAARQIIVSQSNGAGTTFSFWMEKNPSNLLRVIATVGGVQYVALATVTMNLFSWNFLQLVRNGTTLYGYQNGTQVCSVSVGSGSLLDSTDNVTIGEFGAGSGLPVVGYITDVRILKGTASSATTPTSPLTAIANTSLLLNFTNAGIFDNAMMGDYETVGDAQISTTQSKFGGSSIYFDGTGDCLYTTTQTMPFGTGDFTIEFWIYFNAVNNGVVKYIYDFRNAGATASSFLAQEAANTWTYYNGAGTSSTVLNSTIFSASTWYHFAVCRVAGTTKFFVNGTQISSIADTSNYATSTFVLGARYTTASDYLNGYIDDLRITKGIGRYPYNFTPPTAAFPNIGGTVTLTADPYYKYVTMLLPGNGTNGAQNNTFLDSSTNNFTITRNGNTTQGTFAPYGANWSNYFGGSGDYINFASSSALSFASDFTVEAWVYNNYSTGTFNPAVLYDSSSNAISSFEINNGTNYPSVAGITATNTVTRYTFSTSPSVPVLQWVHVAWVRSSGTVKVYVNGTASTSTLSNSAATGQIVQVANGRTSGSPWNGYISNLRITSSAVYTSNFTPSTVPLTAITGTQLLTCQSNRFQDNSSNALSFTTTGSPTVQVFSPFSPTAAYSASTIGGSGYFDGSGDYLQAGTNANLALGSGNFTIEGWHYCTGYNGGGTLYSTINTYPSSTGLLFYISSLGVYTIDVNGTILAGSGAAVLNAWVHWAVVRNGSTLSIYINGTSIGSVSSSTNFTDQYAVIGRTGAGTNSNLFLGYLSNTRMVKGTAVYTSAFTPPTAPVTAIANTQLLCDFTNAGVIDNAMMNDLETVGNAQISTTQSKFGGSSIYLDGTGDWLLTKTSPNLDMGTGDLTVEGWFYLTATVAVDYRMIVSDASNGNNYICIRSGGTGGQLEVNVNGTSFRLNLNNSVTINTWFHLAVTRFNGTWTGFVNGNSLGTSSSSASFNLGNGGMYVGRFGGATAYEWPGYIDDLRITKGIARYTSNFTPPTSAFLLQ